MLCVVTVMMGPVPLQVWYDEDVYGAVLCRGLGIRMTYELGLCHAEVFCDLKPVRGWRGAIQDVCVKVRERKATHACAPTPV